MTCADFEPGAFYGFHVKWNRTGDRLMFVLRWLPHDPSEKQRFFVITMMADGSMDAMDKHDDTMMTDQTPSLHFVGSGPSHGDVLA